MRHEMLPFFAFTPIQKGHAESAIHDACHTSSGRVVTTHYTYLHSYSSRRGAAPATLHPSFHDKGQEHCSCVCGKGVTSTLYANVK